MAKLAVAGPTSDNFETHKDSGYNNFFDFFLFMSGCLFDKIITSVNLQLWQGWSVDVLWITTIRTLLKGLFQANFVSLFRVRTKPSICSPKVHLTDIWDKHRCFARVTVHTRRYTDLCYPPNTLECLVDISYMWHDAWFKINLYMIPKVSLLTCLSCSLSNISH